MMEVGGKELHKRRHSKDSNNQQNATISKEKSIYAWSPWTQYKLIAVL